MSAFTESVVEEAALDWLARLGYAVLHGPDIAAGEPAAERSDSGYRDVVLERRLRAALARLNPDLPPDALEDAHRKLMRLDAPSLIDRNRAVHRMLVDGITVEFRRKDGSIGGAQAPPDRFRGARAERLACGQPIHGGGRTASSAARRSPVRQWPAARCDRTEEHRGRGRRHLGGVPTTPNLSGADSSPVLDQHCAGRVGRRAGADRLARRWARMVQAVAHHHRTRRSGEARRVADRAGGRVRAPALPRSHQVFHRVRGAGRRQARQEDGRLPPVPRRQRGVGGDAPRRDPVGELAQDTGLFRRGRPLRCRADGRRRGRRSPRRRCLAHAGLRQEPDHGVLCRPGDPGARDGESHHRGADRSQRPRRPVVRHLRPLPRPAAAAAGAGG
ncbi:hypothetical protein ACVWWG_003262 [Bradyrhizobium sp. LB7.2]